MKGGSRIKPGSVKQPCMAPLPQVPLQWQQKDKGEGAQGQGECKGLGERKGREIAAGCTDPVWPGRVTGQGWSRGNCGESPQGEEGSQCPQATTNDL